MHITDMTKIQILVEEIIPDFFESYFGVFWQTQVSLFAILLCRVLLGQKLIKAFDFFATIRSKWDFTGKYIQ